jgi:hypothetical protein
MNITTEQAKKVLSDAGYCVENLWHISDVTENYHCTDEQAKELLNDATSDLSFTFDCIAGQAEFMEYREKDEG